MSQENDGFTSGAREKFPNTYSDYQQVGEYATWPQEALESRFYEYTEFLAGDVMPRARETADTILAHLTFELCYRAGWYEAE